jgi:hypothetical protein
VVNQAADYIHERDPRATIWYVGHWGFQFEAERLGMKALAPGRSVLHRGDWLVVPDPSQNQQDFTRDPRMGPPVEVVTKRYAMNRSTRPEYYGGPWPMVASRGTQLSATIYRIQDAWSPEP